MRIVLFFGVCSLITQVGFCDAEKPTSFECHRRSQESSAQAAPDPVAVSMREAILGAIKQAEGTGWGAMAGGEITPVWILGQTRTTIPRWPGQPGRHLRRLTNPLGNEVGLQEWVVYPQGVAAGRLGGGWGLQYPRWGVEATARARRGLHVPR